MNLHWLPTRSSDIVPEIVALCRTSALPDGGPPNSFDHGCLLLASTLVCMHRRSWAYYLHVDVCEGRIRICSGLALIGTLGRREQDEFN
mmetsp:Transcript_66462/g.171881  ORF Transcript_66462/g.171881 Transcript_66462/m.171881 type:complete len:89 (-) Transcript_66462:292-558(-)